MVGYRFFSCGPYRSWRFVLNFLRISDTSCYLKRLMWSLLVRKFCMLLLSTPFSKHHHSTQSIQCRLSFMFCGAQNFDFPQSPKRPSYCVGVLCWQQHQKQQPAWTTTYLLHCIPVTGPNAIETQDSMTEQSPLTTSLRNLPKLAILPWFLECSLTALVAFNNALTYHILERNTHAAQRF